MSNETKKIVKAAAKSAPAPVAPANPFVYVALSDIELILDKASPIYDARVEEPLNPVFLAQYKEKGAPTAPIVLATRENVAQFGTHLKGKYTPNSGRQRVRYCLAAGIPFIAASFKQFDSTLDFMREATEENTHRVEMTDWQRVERARQLVQMGATPAQVARTFGIEESGVKTLLRISDPTEATDKVREAVKEGILSPSAAMHVMNETSPVEQDAIADAARETVVTAVATGATGKGTGVVVTENPDTGEVKASVSVQKSIDLKNGVKTANGTAKPKVAAAVKAKAVAQGVEALFIKLALANIERGMKLPACQTPGGLAFAEGCRAALKRLLEPGCLVEATGDEAIAARDLLCAAVKKDEAPAPAAAPAEPAPAAQA